MIEVKKLAFYPLYFMWKEYSQVIILKDIEQMYVCMYVCIYVCMCYGTVLGTKNNTLWKI